MPPKKTAAPSKQPESKTEEIPRQGLKAAVWYTVTKIVQEEELKCGKTCSSAFIAGLTEMIWAQMETMSLDMQAFAQHRQSHDIRPEEVLLLARRNPALKESLEKEATEQDIVLPGAGKKAPAKPKPAPKAGSSSKRKKDDA